MFKIEGVGISYNFRTKIILNDYSNFAIEEMSEKFKPKISIHFQRKLFISCLHFITHLLKTLT